MPATYEPIATTTLASAQASITFSSVPSTYTDLRALIVGTGSAAISVNLRFNNDTGSNYSLTWLVGSGSAASSNRATANTSIYLNAGNWSTTIPSFETVDIFSYSGSTNKTVLVTDSNDLNGSGSVYRAVGLWRNTSAIGRAHV